MKRISEDDLLSFKAALYSCSSREQVYMVLSAFMYDGWNVLQINGGVLLWGEEATGTGLMEGSHNKIQQFFDDPTYGLVLSEAPELDRACKNSTETVIEVTFAYREAMEKFTSESQEGEEWKSTGR